MSDEPDLLKPDTEVTDKELQIELGNLNAENEALKISYKALLESSTLVTDNLRVENEALKISYKALLESSTAVTNNLRQELIEVRSRLEAERADREEVESQLSDLKQNSAPIAIGVELPEPADLLNLLKGRRKKSKTDLADVETILEILEK